MVRVVPSPDGTIYKFCRHHRPKCHIVRANADSHGQLTATALHLPTE
eukprot:COSAG05_NODE_14334_length_399_cov_11.973333_1_plen_46_part_10